MGIIFFLEKAIQITLKKNIVVVLDIFKYYHKGMTVSTGVNIKFFIGAMLFKF